LQAKLAEESDSDGELFIKKSKTAEQEASSINIVK
jgi:hypothetical protein